VNVTDFHRPARRRPTPPIGWAPRPKDEVR
jgi:hypothetical protein